MFGVICQSTILASTHSVCSSTYNIDSTGGVDWVMPANAAYVVLRFGSCYADGDGVNSTDAANSDGSC